MTKSKIMVGRGWLRLAGHGGSQRVGLVGAGGCGWVRKKVGKLSRSRSSASRSRAKKVVDEGEEEHGNSG